MWIMTSQLSPWQYQTQPAWSSRSACAIKTLTKDEFIKHQSAMSRRCDAARSKMREKRKLRKLAEKMESQHWDAVRKNRRNRRPDPLLCSSWAPFVIVGD